MGPTCHICLLRAPPFSLPPFFHPIPPDSSRRRAPTQPPLPFHAARRTACHPRATHAACALSARAPRTQSAPVPPAAPSARRPCAATTKRLRTATTATPRHHHAQNRRSRTTHRPRSSASRRSRSRSVLAGCSTYCPCHFLHCFRAAFAFPHSCIMI